MHGNNQTASRRYSRGAILRRPASERKSRHNSSDVAGKFGEEQKPSRNNVASDFLQRGTQLQHHVPIK
jgi:hypothetical protein